MDVVNYYIYLLLFNYLISFLLLIYIIIEVNRKTNKINQLEFKIENLTNYTNVKRIEILDEKIELNLKEFNETIESYKNEINNLNNQNLLFQEKINLINETVNSHEKNISDIYNKLSQFEIKIQQLEKYHTISNFSLTNLLNVKIHDKQINLISKTPSDNFMIAVDTSIKFLNSNFELIYEIPNAHEERIIYSLFKNETTLITCSEDKSIKIWIKQNDNSFIEKISINDAHEHHVRHLIFTSNNYLISCSWDKTIKIWEERDNNYINIKTLSHDGWVNTLLYIEKSNILITCGYDGIKFWNMSNYEEIKYLTEGICTYHQSLIKIDEDNLILGGFYDGVMSIVSISKMEIILKIYNNFAVWGMIYFEYKGIFIVGGMSNDIQIYDINQFKCINSLVNINDFYINGFLELVNGKFLSYDEGGNIQIWELKDI